MTIKKEVTKLNSKQASDNAGQSTKAKQDETAAADITKHKPVRESLSKNPAKLLQLTINEVPVSITAVNLDKHFLSCNKACCAFLGYSEKELIQKNIDDITFPDDVKICAATMGALMTGEAKSSVIQKRYLRKDGSIVWGEVHINLIRDAQNQPLYFLLIIIDISERKLIEDALKSSEQNFRNSMDSSSLGIRIVDLEGQTLYANQTLMDIFGYNSADEVISHPPQEYFTPESYAGFTLRKEQRLRGETIQNKVEIDIVRKDGAIRNLQVNSKDVVWNGKKQLQIVYNDITERKQIEEALKAAERNFHNFMDNSPLGIRIRDADGSVSYANRAFLDIFGYKNAAESEVHPPQEYYSPESYATFIKRRDKIDRDEEVESRVEVDVVRKDGTIRHVQIFGHRQLWDGKQQAQTYFNDVTDRKQVEDALKASEQNFHNSLDNTSIGIRISDNKDHTSYVNKAFLDIFGYENIEEVIANPPQKYYSPETHASWVLRHDKFMRGEPMPKQVDVDIIRKDGTIRHLDISMKEIFWDGKKQNQTLYNDITERKQAEEAQRLSEQNFRSSMDNASIGIRISDKNDRTSYVNKSLLAIFGYENIDEVIANPPPKYYTPEAHASWVLRHEKFMRGEPMPKQVDIDIIRKDGTIRHLDVSMKDVFWDGQQQNQTLYNDITERTQAEAALHESEEKYRLIVENSSDIIFTLNAAGDFIYVSSSVKNILGYNAADLVGRQFKSLVHPDEMEIVQTSIQHNIQDGYQTPGGTEYRVRHFSGEWRWHNGTGNVVRDANGKFLYFLGIARDITDMKRLEQETKQANERLTSMVKKLEEQQRQNVILTEMRDMLQACSKMEETAPIIMGSMKKLFPTSQGALFLLSNSRSDLESVVTWGDFPVSSDNNVFTPDACWGLRRGRAHVVDDVNVGPICPHLINTPAAPYVCLPLMAKGDILGLLHLKNAFSTHGSGNQEIADLRQMATTLSEYLSLSIANVKLSESLSRQSIQDPQTGLYNRRFMEESLQREITRAARKQTHIGVIMGDLDHFKKFNDVYGHAAGDKIIAQIGKVFNDRFRGSDIACRYGGEEFLVILPETTLEDTFKRADVLREDIKKMEMVFQGQILGTITMSMGIAAYPEKGARMEELLRIADTALYKAKQEGRDRVISG